MRPLRAAALAALLAAAAAASAAGAPRTPANRCAALLAGAKAAGPFFFKPTGLQTTLLADAGAMLLASDADGAVAKIATPGPAAEWRLAARHGGFAVRSTETQRWLAAGATGTGTKPVVFRVVARKGCKAWPEAGLNVKGHPFRGRRKDGTVLGFADAHFHPTADLRAGGQVIYGPAFHRFGITEALGHDADEHGPDGSLDVTGNLLRSGNAAGTHDTQGWPAFTGWPVFDTYTHQQVYYRWLQRAWLSGMRLAVAQIVEDEPLCTIEPTKSHSCDETETIKLEVQRLRDLQDYVDAQSGGRGRGWFRLVYDPAQARRVIERGKLAVVIGVESNSPFGCSVRNGEPQCERADVDAGIALFHQLGIRALFIAHWTDNAFAGAALEGGDKGTFIGTFQVTQTGSPFMTGPCPEAGEGEDGECNTRGLTELGEYLVRKLMDAHMLIEGDHLSEQSRRDVFALAEARHYPLVSSHNGTGGRWVPSQLERLHALGGYVSATPDTADLLGPKIAALGRYGFSGVGLGTDTGGFGALPGPAPDAAENPLVYPFRSFAGRMTFARERTGTRTFDLNADGVAHYGLLPDLLTDLQRRAGGRAALRRLFRSAEAYLRTWTRVSRAR